ncbi:MAG: hypothetical protein P8X79_19750 [Reinekea sp.]
MLRGEPMGAPAIFEKQIEIKLLHPASTLESRIQVNISHHCRPIHSPVTISGPISDFSPEVV